MHRTQLFGLALALSLAATACASSGSQSSSGTQAPTTAPAAAVSPSPAAAASAAAVPSLAAAPSPSPAAARSPASSPAASAVASPSATASTTVQVVNDPKLGAILADARGFTLYRFDRDKSGVSNCTGGCLNIWPPVTATGTPTGPSSLTGKLATLTRSDTGAHQVTYNGIPLYTYTPDKTPGSTSGNGVNNVWHVVHPTDTTP